MPTILHETSDWLVVDKPAGWHSVDATRSDGSPTIEQWLAEERPELAALNESGLAHRLDRETSGCLLAAKNALLQEGLRAAFAGRDGAWTVKKTYIALVHRGIDASGSWTLSFTNRHKGSAKVTVGRHGDPSHRGTCRWTRREHRGPHDLVEIELVGPGRRHQIRAGFAFIGHALAGDELYRVMRGAPTDPLVRPHAGAEPLALHAWRLEVNGVEVLSPRPEWGLGIGD